MIPRGSLDYGSDGLVRRDLRVWIWGLGEFGASEFGCIGDPYPIYLRGTIGLGFRIWGVGSLFWVRGLGLAAQICTAYRGRAEKRRLGMPS